MTKKQKRMLRRIILAAVLYAAAAVLCQVFAGLPWPAQAVLYLIPYFIIGYDVLRKAVLGVVHGEVFDENFLMAVATVGAMCLGEYGEGVAVMLFYQVGELFQSYAVGKSRRSIAGLMDIRPDSANLEEADGGLRTVDPEEVPVGAVIVVRPGEKIPLDGTVLEGESSLNTAALTGESRPRSARPGDAVISGSVNVDGVLRVQVTKPYGQSTVARILDLVENSSLKKAKAENFITKFARYYTPAVCFAALALAVLPPLVLGGGWAMWIKRALTFLVISCPCALVISIPLTFFGGIGGASRCGILVKGGNYLEALAHTGTVVFDKTGTLTKGVFKVSRVSPAPGRTEQEVLELAAAAESYSSHPISKSLREACPACILQATDAQEIAGHGVSAQVDGHTVLAGNAKLMEAKKIPYTPDDGVGTVVYLACDGTFWGSILISDEVKPTARQAMDSLHSLGVRTVMLTGDSKAVAAGVAGQLGMDDFHAELLPDDKVRRVEELLADKSRGNLAFVGDGINDAPVLMRADIGIAMGALGSDAAIEAADVVLMDDDPAKIGLAMRMARRCMSIVYQNIVFALGVKLLFLLLGAVGIANMWWAVFADVGVMVLAVLNATRMLSIRAYRK
ncbi:heavy metal translocating P-type ATPase [uncultured Gemmiger sp.]|uniref:heavy metal translocating P-type ATPase n=1 Tax=uncultured Gemmiger sp. TaxID=1623490 RepID=UPI0025D431DF|nr:heavy metal translocating P-type ATPase [uncultured Gemmiger sp.]